MRAVLHPERSNEPGRARTRKKRSFVWRQGVLRFGVPVSTLVSVSIFLNEHGWSLESLTEGANVAGLLVGFVISALVGGFIWGSLFWHFFPKDMGRDDLGGS